MNIPSDKLLRISILPLLAFSVLIASGLPSYAAKTADAKPKAAATKPAPKKKKAESAARVWTATNGHEIKAEFVEVKGREVILKDEEGNKRNILLVLLTPADRELAQKLQAEKAAGTTYETVQKSSTRLPVFAKGPNKNYHAVYRTENYVAHVQDTTAVTIQCMENGEKVGKPITLNSYRVYRDPKKNRPTSRKIASFKEAYTPVDQPDKLLFEGMLDDQVKFGIGIEFTAKTVETWGWIIDPPGIKFPTTYHRYFRFAPTHRFEPHVTVAKQKKTLEPYSVVVKPVKGAAVTYPYGDIVTGWHKESSRASIEGPVFGGRKVSVSLGSSARNGVLRPWIYSRYAPYQGFHMRLYKTRNEAQDDKCRIILTIE